MKKVRKQKKITVGKTPSMFQVSRDRDTFVCRVYVLENQGLTTLAFSFTNFDEPDHFPVSQGGTKMISSAGKANMSKGAHSSRAVTVCRWSHQPAQMWRNI